MTLLVLSARDLPGLLPYPEAVAAMRQVLLQTFDLSLNLGCGVGRSGSRRQHRSTE